MEIHSLFAAARSGEPRWRNPSRKLERLLVIAAATIRGLFSLAECIEAVLLGSFLPAVLIQHDSNRYSRASAGQSKRWWCGSPAQKGRGVKSLSPLQGGRATGRSQQHHRVLAPFLCDHAKCEGSVSVAPRLIVAPSVQDTTPSQTLAQRVLIKRQREKEWGRCLSEE